MGGGKEVVKTTTEFNSHPSLNVYGMKGVCSHDSKKTREIKSYLGINLVKDMKDLQDGKLQNIAKGN